MIWNENVLKEWMMAMEMRMLENEESDVNQIAIDDHKNSKEIGNDPQEMRLKKKMKANENGIQPER